MVYAEVGMKIETFKEPWAGGRYVATFLVDRNWIDVETWCFQFKAEVSIKIAIKTGYVERMCQVRFRQAKQLSWFLLRWA